MKIVLTKHGRCRTFLAHVYQMLHNNYVMMLSKAEAINPVTKTNWEGVSVILHVKTTKQKVLDEAHLLALQNLVMKQDEQSTYFIWHSDTVKAKSQPINLSMERLQRYVMKYFADNGDMREIELKNAQLYYGEIYKEKERLIILDKSTFTLSSNKILNLK